MARSYLLKNATRKMRMPSVGLGTYQLIGEEGRKAIDSALFLGYKHLDTARRYGNERDIGEVVNARIKSGHTKRSGLFITTKIPATYMSKDDVRMSLEMSLEELKTTYVDMLLIHFPWGNVNRGDGDTQPCDENGNRLLKEYDLNETWSAMEELVDAGKVSAIGLSNFSIRLIDRIWEKARIKPANLQSECHVHLNQSNLLNYCHSRNIVMTGYAPFGAPHLPTWEPDTRPPLENETVKKIAANIGKSPSQVLLRHLLQKNIAVIPKAFAEERIKENMDVYDFELSKVDMVSLDKLDRKMKLFPFDWAKPHPLYIKGEEF